MPYEAQNNIRLPIERVSEVLSAYAKYRGWKFSSKGINSVVVKEGFQVMRNPIECAFDLRPISPGVTKVSVSASAKGFRGSLGLLGAESKTMVDGMYEALRAVETAITTAVNESIQAGVICPVCKTELAPGTKFCPKDGTRITKTCPKCQHENAPGNTFCAQCGASI